MIIENYTKLFKEPDIMVVLEDTARLRWAGHIIRMSDSEMPQRIINYNSEGSRKAASPNVRWIS
jgi:hypothetical protein